MNFLYGKINWRNNKKKKKTDIEFNNSALEIVSKRFNTFIFDKKAYFYNERSKNYSSIIGTISNLGEIKEKYNINENLDVEIVEKLYRILDIKFIYELKGVYLGFIFDYEKNKGYIFQSRYGTNLPVYFIHNEEGITFSTSLKSILKDFPYDRKLNLKAVKDFLSYTYGNIVPNELTLIDGIKKLVSHEYIEIDINKKSVIHKKFKKKLKNISKKNAKLNLLNYIRKSLGVFFDNKTTNDVTLTLTGGYDTNLVLYFLRQFTKDPLLAVIIDGGGTFSEVPRVKEVIEEYNDVELLVGKLNNDVINDLPDMVWKYDGYVFDRGIFLRYQLAKLLNQNKRESVILGACADQILYPKSFYFGVKINVMNFLFSVLRIRINSKEFKMRSKMRSKIRRLFLKIKVNFQIDYLIKLHDIVLNAFGVQSIFPFLNDDIEIASKALGIKLAKAKRFYRSQVNKLLNKNITKQLVKSGAASDTKSIFLANQDLLLKIFDTDFIKDIFSKKQINNILKSPVTYHLLIFQLVYIYLFDKLFISGDFDKFFDKSDFIMPLSDFF